jgi:hypothetical protein
MVCQEKMSWSNDLQQFISRKERKEKIAVSSVVSIGNGM